MRGCVKRVRIVCILCMLCGTVATRVATGRVGTLSRPDHQT